MKPIALITGASGGIGGAIAKALASDGYALALQYRSNREAIESLIRSLQPDTPYLPLACDLNDAAAVERMIETLHRTFGRPSAVIHAAGIAPRQALFSDTDDTMLSEVFATNAFAPMRLTRNLLYTAMTRAKSMVVLVGSEEIIRRMVENNHVSRRYTTLALRLAAVQH